MREQGNCAVLHAAKYACKLRSLLSFRHRCKGLAAHLPLACLRLSRHLAPAWAQRVTGMHLSSNGCSQRRLGRRSPFPLPAQRWPGSPALAGPPGKWGWAAWALCLHLESDQTALQLLRLLPDRQ